MIRARVEAQNAHCEIPGGEKIVHRDGRDPIDKDDLIIFVPTAVTKSVAADGTRIYICIYVCVYVVQCKGGRRPVISRTIDRLRSVRASGHAPGAWWDVAADSS
jgi:hypothetical protein